MILTLQNLPNIIQHFTFCIELYNNSVYGISLRCSSIFFLKSLYLQDTLYLHYGKQYLRDCYIEGSVDFIFGNSTALIEHSHIHCKAAGFITAQSRKTSQETTGYVFFRFVNPLKFFRCLWNKFVNRKVYTTLVLLWNCTSVEICAW